MSAPLASNVVDLAQFRDAPAPPGMGHNGGPEFKIDGEPGCLPLGDFRGSFEDYVTVKSVEIDEGRLSWNYYDGKHWTAEQLAVLRKRNQPPIVFNFVDIVTDGAVGVIAATGGNPKAFPRGPNDEEAAEVATECLRNVLDNSNWEFEENECTRDAYVGGIAVAYIDIVEGDQGDDDVNLARMDPKAFYYDPTSTRADFTDGRFMGSSSWCTIDGIDELFPGSGELVSDWRENGGALTAYDSDRDALWVNTKGRVRLVEHWYKEAGRWKFCFYAGNVQLMAGDSPYFDEKGKPGGCRIHAYANRIDQDGVHHGFVRRLKGPQDAVNQHRSKAIHIMNTRQLKRRRGAGGQSDEEARREAARPDGIMYFESDPDEVQVIPQQMEFLQQTQYYADAVKMLEQFGPTQAASHGDKSGRAIAMIMQAGMAQLGPFVTNRRNWRLRLYRAAWAQVKNTWTNQRMIRVSGDEDAPKFLAVNQPVMGQGMDPMTGAPTMQPQIDPTTGQPAMQNALSNMNVDIILDEGANTPNVMSDVFDLLGTLAQNKVPVPPAALIEASSLPGSVKKKLTAIMTAPNPVQQAGEAATLENKQADTAKKAAEAEHSLALARREHGTAAMNAHSAAIAAIPAPPEPAPVPVAPQGF